MTGSKYPGKLSGANLPQSTTRPQPTSGKKTGETWADTGKPKRNPVLRQGAEKELSQAGNWSRMPRLMIAKCAEMQALRAGWPDQFAGLYDEAEMDRAKVESLASEQAAAEQESQRLRTVTNNSSITMVWSDPWSFDQVPVEDFVDRCASFFAGRDAGEIARWADANRLALKMFWAKRPGEALVLKKMIETASIVARPSSIQDACSATPDHHS